MPALRSDGKPLHVKVKKKKPKPKPSLPAYPTPKPKAGPPTPKRKPKPPTKTEVRRARAQEDQYESQGKAVERVAGEQRRVRRARTQEKEYESQGRSVERQAKRQALARRLDIRRQQTQRSAVPVAPVLKALEQTTRPLHAVAATERAIVKSLKSGDISLSRGKFNAKKVGEAALKGLKNEDKSTYSDVLGDLGVKKGPVRSTLGFAGDVVGDPLTYVSGGTGSVIRRQALKDAARAEKKAVKAGLSKEQAERFGERARKQAEKKGTDSRGVTVEVAGKEVPGVRRATAATGRVVKRATDKPKIVRKAKEKARHLAADVNPSVTPDNISRESFREVRRATRTARSSTAREIAKTKERAVSIRKRVGKEDREVLDAIEAGTVRKLSPEKREVAKRLQDQFKYARRLERRAGIPVKERKGYVPHALKDPGADGKNAVPRVGSMKITPTFSKARKEQRTLKELRDEAPGRYSEDTAVLYANRLIESHVASNKAKLNRRLLDMGRRVRRGDEVELGQGEKVFNVKGSDIREVTEKREIQRFVDEGDSGRGGQYVVLNEQVVDRAVKNIIPTAERTAAGAAFDKVQGGWKWLATVPNVGFHVRNFVGDAQNAFLAESAPRLAANTVRSFRALKRVGKEEERRRKSLPGTPAELQGKGVKVDGKKVSYEDLIREAESVGAIRAGFINRELPELVKSGTGVKKIRKSVRPGRSVARFVQNREDLFRLATYIGSRNRGLSPEKAAERAAKFHFDYADLTQLERTVLRRVAPFYTFSARNIPLQLTSYFAKPGKYAQYQKIREEFAKAFGVDLDEQESNLSEYEQRSAPVPVKWKGEEFTLSFGPSGLPLTDLNELPMGKPTEAADEWFQRAVSLLSPAIKTPLEYGMNYSFFFRDQLERDEGPLVPAPAFVGKLPAGVRKKLRVVPDYVDKRTGKKGWGWSAKADYVANLFPGPFGLGKRLATDSDRRGENTQTKLIAGAGLRIRKVDAPSAAINRLYDEKAELTKKRYALNQRGVNAKNPSKEWRRLSDEIKRLEAEINVQREKRGDKIIPKRGRPRVTKVDEPGAVEWVDGTGGAEWVD